MIFTNFIRGLVRKKPLLKDKLKRAGSKQTPFQYVYQTVSMTIMSLIVLIVMSYIFFKDNLLNLLVVELIVLCTIPFLYSFWLSYVDVQIRRYGRELDSDLLFVSEYFLVSLESGLPLGNAIQRLARLDRPGGRFFKKVFTEFKTGKDLERALNDASIYSASDSLKILLKRLKDSLSIGVDLRVVLSNFIEESSEKKVQDIRAYSKRLNPVIMMYLVLGIVLPSLGVTFFILAAALLELSTEMLKYILILVFLLMFGFQYISYSSFKFTKSTL